MRQYQDNIVQNTVFPFFLLAAGLLVTIAIYYLGLSGPFIFDDSPQIQYNSLLRIESLSLSELWYAAFSSETGPLQRPLSMLSFALNYYFFGENTTSFKVTNLGIHIANGLLIFLLSQTLLNFLSKQHRIHANPQKINLVSALITILWLVHPINLTSILYVVQRMTSLSALFTLLSLLTYIKGRLSFPEHRLQAITLWSVSLLFWLCAMASKENAVLLPWYIFLIEWIFFYPAQQTTLGRKIYTFSWFIVPLLCGLIYLALYPGTINYDFRSFSLWERVLTQTRALWFYAGLIFIPRPAALGIFHDDFIISTNLLTPWTTLPAVLGLLLVFIFTVLSVRKYPLLAFGILFFFFAHGLESSIFPLEIMHEHRNYLAGYGLIFGFIGFILLTENFFKNKKMIWLIIGFFGIFFSAVTLGRTMQWQEPTRLILSMVDRHPASASSNYEAGRLYIFLRDKTSDWLQKDELNEIAIQYFKKAAELSSFEPAYQLAIITANASNSKSNTPKIIEETSRRLKEGQPTALTISSLTFLSSCETEKKCFILSDQVEAFFNDLLDNPNLRTTLHRALLINNLASRAVKHEEFSKAELLFKELLNLDKTRAIFQLNYAAFLIRVNRLEEAGQQIKEILAKPQPDFFLELANNYQGIIDQGGLSAKPTEEPQVPAPDENLFLKELSQPKGDRLLNF